MLNSYLDPFTEPLTYRGVNTPTLSSVGVGGHSQAKTHIRICTLWLCLFHNVINLYCNSMNNFIEQKKNVASNLRNISPLLTKLIQNSSGFILPARVFTKLGVLTKSSAEIISVKFQFSS